MLDLPDMLPVAQTVRSKHKMRSVALSRHGPPDGALLTLALLNNSLEVGSHCALPIGQCNGRSAGPIWLFLPCSLEKQSYTLGTVWHMSGLTSLDTDRQHRPPLQAQPRLAARIPLCTLASAQQQRSKLIAGVAGEGARGD